ncbi:MAG: M13 family metallopeptidase [Clostridiales bacterium]|nr:M13 family metallopeptidase [Clostridiales bacterium]
MRKVLSLLLSLTFLFSVMLPVNALGEDYLTRGEAAEIIVSAADDYNPGVEISDILKGDSQGNLYEDRTVTKLEVFIMLDRAFGDYPEIKGSSLITNNTGAEYTDLPDWAKTEMSQVLAAGITDGTSRSTFGINENVTEAGLQKYLKRVYAVFGTNLKDDFYTTVNKGFLDSIVINGSRPGDGRIYEAVDTNWERIYDIISDCINSSSEAGSKEEKIRNYVENYIDMDSRNSLTAESIAGDYLEDIENIETIADFQAFNEKLFDELGVSVINFGVTIDSEDSSSFTAYFYSPSPAQSKETYTGGNDTYKNAYIKYLNTILVLSGESQAEAEADTLQYFEAEKKIAEKSLDAAEQYNLDNTYNIYTVSELDKIYDELGIQALYEMSGLTHLDKILVDDVGAMEEAADLFTSERIDDLRNYCKVSMIDYIAEYLGQDYIDAIDAYDMETLGTSESSGLLSDLLDDVSTVFEDYIGEMYVERYCSDETAAEIKVIAEEIIDIYRERIGSAEWMSEATKENAKHKLDTMTINVGGPEEYIDYYADADIKSKAEGGSYFQNTTELIKASNRSLIEESKKPFDKTQWFMSPQTVNACYSAVQNGIYIPAAFLQEPLYSADYSYEEKLGKIGIMIGHEISHAFDSSGAQYDENGNASNWWTEEDKAKFEELCGEIISVYDEEEWCVGADVNGELTLTENIADLGAMSVVLDLAEKTEGFDYDSFFRAFADYFVTAYTREVSIYLSQADSHSPASSRVNVILRNSDRFYSTYGIDETDGMYVPHENRIGIW